jgi:hypothetical protein
MEGWDSLRQADNTDFKKKLTDADDFARICLRAFTTEEGQKVMEWLEETYVDVPVAVPGSDPSYAFYAEGCRNVVRDLQRKIKHAREEN